MTLAISVELVLGLSLLGFWIWDGRKMKRNVAGLAQGLAVSNSTTHAFMKECEGALSEVYRLISKTESASNPLVETVNASQPGSIVAESFKESKFRPDVISPHVELAPISGKSGTEKKNQVLHMAEKGISATEIANELGIPRGEVDLILCLCKGPEKYATVKSGSM